LLTTASKTSLGFEGRGAAVPVKLLLNFG